MLNSSNVPRPPRRRRSTVSFWIVTAIVLLMIISLAASGGFGAVVAILGVVALITGLYALLFKRRSWVGLPHRKSAAIVAGSGVLALFIGSGIATATAAPKAPEPPVVEAVTPTATPTPTATDPAGTACSAAEELRAYQDQVLICTQSTDGQLVWLPEAESKAMIATKKAEEKAAADKKIAAQKAAAKKAAAEKAAAKKAAAKKAAAKKAAADKVAAAKAAADAAAAQQAAVPVAPFVPAQPAAPASAYYPNCSAARAAGAAPVYVGSPGYGRHLDRDGDGVGCE